MPMIAGVRIRLTEAILCREQGDFEYGAWLRGSVIPLPTTISGSLACAGWCRNERCTNGKDRWEAMSRCIASLLRSELGVTVERVKVRGPVATDGEKLFIGCAEGLVEVSVGGISGWVRRQTEGERPGKRAGQVKHRMILPENILRERTGVGLLRGKKVVNEDRGLLYTAPYVYYYYEDYENNRKHRRILNLATDIIAENSESDENVARESKKLPLRLGGEDRKALATITIGKPEILSILESVWEKHETDGALLVLATPMILPKNVSYGRIEKHLLEAIQESIKEVAELEKEEIYSVHPRVRPRISPLQMGFDERNKRKGEIRTALLPGIVVKVRMVGDWRELYAKGAGELAEIGFGTLLPIPYKP